MGTHPHEAPFYKSRAHSLLFCLATYLLSLLACRRECPAPTTAPLAAPTPVIAPIAAPFAAPLALGWLVCFCCGGWVCVAGGWVCVAGGWVCDAGGAVVGCACAEPWGTSAVVEESTIPNVKTLTRGFILALLAYT